MQTFVSLRRFRLRVNSTAAVFAGVMAALSAAHAQTTNTWNINASGLWNVATNWSPTNIPNGIGTVAFFGSNITAARTITNDAAVTLGGMEFGTNTFAYTINNELGALIFDGLGATSFINIHASNSANNQILTTNGTVLIADRLVINHDGSGTFTFAGAMASFGLNPGLTVSGASTNQVILLAGGNGFNDSTFNGSVNLDRVTVRVDADRAFGAVGNAVNFTNGATLFFRTNFTVDAGRVFTFNSDSSLLVTNVTGVTRWNAANRLMGPGNLTKSGLGSIVVGQSNVNYTGAVFVNAGGIVVSNAAALGSNPRVTVSPLARYESLIGAPGGGSVFNVASNGIIAGSNLFLGSLSRGTTLIASPNAIIAERAASGNNSVANRGTDSDLFFGLATNVVDSATVSEVPGTTSWKGISTDGFNRSLSNSTITAAGNFHLQAVNVSNTASILTLGDGSATPTFITISAASPVTAFLDAGTIRLDDPNSQMGNVTFQVRSGVTLGLRSATALGGSGNNTAATKASVEVLDGGTLTIDNVSNTTVSVNSSVTVRSNGVLIVNALDGSPTNLAAGLNGVGAITLDDGAVIRLSNTNALTGTQLTPAGIGANKVIQLNTSAIKNISQLDPLSIISVHANGLQVESINLDGNLLTSINTANRTLSNNAVGAQILVTSAGGTIAAPKDGGTTLRTLTIQCEINAAGPLYIGSTNVLAFDDSPRTGTVQLDNTVFPAGDLNWVAGNLAFGRNNSTNFFNGTLLTNVVVPAGSWVQFLFQGVDSNNVFVSQLITMTGALDTNDERSMILTTNLTGATAMLMTLTNIHMRDGAVLAIDEAGVNARVSMILDGPTATYVDTADSDTYDFLDILAGTPGAPRTLFLGRTNTADGFATPFVLGTVGDNFTFEQINGGIRFSNSAILGANMVINNLGTNFVHSSGQPYRDGVATFDLGRDGGTNNLQTANVTINLGSGQDVSVVVDETDSTNTLISLTNIFYGHVNILSNQAGLLIATRGLDSSNVSTVIFNDVTLQPNSTCNLQAAQETNILANATLLGDSVIVGTTATSFRQFLGNANLNGHTLRIGGTNRINLIGTISAGGAVIVTNGARLGGIGTVAGTLTVNDSARLEPGLGGQGILNAGGSADLQAGSTNVFEIFGPLPGSGYDRLIVGGVATLSGALSVSAVLTNYLPHPTNFFTILTSASRSGTFTNAPHGSRIPTAQNDGSFLVLYDATSVTLADFASPVDLDGDGLSDTWALKYFGVSPLASNTGPTDLFGDFDGDGRSNFQEFISGTDPTSSNSVLRIIAAGPVGSNAFALQFSYVATNLYHTPVYSIEYSTDFTTWSNVAVPTLTFPLPDVAQWTDDGSQTGGIPPRDLFPPRFYRLRAQ